MDWASLCERELLKLNWAETRNQSGVDSMCKGKSVAIYFINVFQLFNNTDHRKHSLELYTIQKTFPLLYLSVHKKN